MLDVRSPRGDLHPAVMPLVGRTRLLRRIRAVGTPLLLLNAPAGYGKSVLLSQWAELEPRRVETISLDGEDNDPVPLVRSILVALERIEPLPNDISEAAAGPAPDIERRVIPRLQEALAERQAPFVLMLDDLDEIESPESLRAISRIAAFFPGGSQLALATRSDPGIPIGRLRAHRGMTELGRADLAMNKSECQELLASLGIDPTPPQLDLLVRRTEGWPAALHLAGLALSEAADPAKTIAEFAGDDRIVVDYIREELLGGVSRRRLEFLRRLSIVERVSGGLSDHVLGRTGSASVLRDLSRTNMLLTPLDRRDEWFRFHPLLREMLRGDLHRIEPELEASLHRRAADWWAEQGNPDEVIDHAIEAGDLDRAGAALWEVYPEHSSGKRQATITRWLHRIGPQGVASEPHLSLIAAFDGVTNGSGAQGDHWAASASELSAKMAPSPARNEMLGAVALVRAVLAREGTEKMGNDAAAAGEALGDASPWISVCRLIEGVALHLRGLRDRARTRLGEAARRAAVVSPVFYVLSLSQLALLAIEEADWQEAEVFAAQARAQLDASEIGAYPLMALALAVSSLVSAHSGQHARAAADSRRAQKSLGIFDEFAPWYMIEARVVLAQAAVRLDDTQTASGLLDAATRPLRGIPDATVLDQWVERTRASAEAVSASGVTQLTPAELRVLQYMPTHLTFTEIADEIVVSANTVKTQAQAVYRKLHVSSRSEAVEEARSAGLLDDAPAKHPRAL